LPEYSCRSSLVSANGFANQTRRDGRDDARHRLRPARPHLVSETHRTPEMCVVRLITQRSRVQIPPPPPSIGASRGFLRTHRPLTSTFGRRLLCLWGQFSGTCSAVRTQPMRGGADASGRHAAVSRSRFGLSQALHRHALCMPMQLPYSKVVQGLGTAISTSAEMTTGRLRGAVATRSRFGRGFRRRCRTGGR
jgi:hypothetical protein